MCLNTCFQFLNNITCIFTHFFTYTYFQKIQITLLEQYYQTGPKGLNLLWGVCLILFLMGTDPCMVVSCLLVISWRHGLLYHTFNYNYEFHIFTLKLHVLSSSPLFSPLSIFARLWWSLNLLQVWDESKGATRKDKQSTEITGISQLRKYLRCVWDCNTKETNNTTLTYFQSSVWFHIESYSNMLSIVSVSHFTLISLGVDFSILLISWPNVH